MPVFNRFRLLSDRELADGAGVNPDAATAAVVPLTFGTLNPDAVAAPLDSIDRCFPYGDHVVRFASLRGDDPGVIAEVPFLQGDDANEAWFAARAAAPNTVLDNGLFQACRNWLDLPVGMAGTMRVHGPFVVLDGATYGEFTPPIPNGGLIANAHLEPIGGTTSRGEIAIGEFAEDGQLPSDAADGLRAWLQTTRSRTEILNPANQAQPIVLDECAFAGFDPSGRAYISPSDIGIGPALIDPDSPAGNTVEKLRLHPTVFLRRVGNVRGVTTVNMRPLGWTGEPINVYQGAPEFYVPVVAPVGSHWRLYIDGARVDVNVLHGSLDLRRPRDVWQRLIVPVLTAGASYADPFIVPTGQPGSTDAIGTAGNPLTPSASLTTLRYLQAARCMGFIFTGVPPEGGYVQRLPQVPAAGPR